MQLAHELECLLLAGLAVELFGQAARLGEQLLRADAANGGSSSGLS